MSNCRHTQLGCTPLRTAATMLVLVALSLPQAEAKSFASLSWLQIQAIMKTDTGSVQPNKAIVYHSPHPVVVVEQVLPGFPYPSFEVDNQKNPTLVFTHGANITFYVINTSQVAPHSFAITSAAPPYAIVPADHRVSHPQVNTGDLPILPQSGRYSYAKVTWTAPNPGSYYYLCMFPVHASFGMWGKIQVR